MNENAQLEGATPEAKPAWAEESDALQRLLGGSSRATYQVIPRAQVARLRWRALRAERYIHEQADQVLANKQIRDMREDWRAAQVCGCRQCRWAYRMTLAFYASLGLRPPAPEDVSTAGLTWYTRRGGASPSEHR
jgi:hypothetical protein